MNIQLCKNHKNNNFIRKMQKLLLQMGNSMSSSWGRFSLPILRLFCVERRRKYRVFLSQYFTEKDH